MLLGTEIPYRQPKTLVPAYYAKWGYVQAKLIKNKKPYKNRCKIPQLFMKLIKIL